MGYAAGSRLPKVLKNPYSTGFSLIEMMIVLVILGFLAAVAIPSYQASVRKSNRSVAQAGLMDIANRQEQFYLNNKTYTDSLDDLGFPAALTFDLAGESAVAYNSNQAPVDSTAADRVYFFKIDSATATAFSLSAVPQVSQTYDGDCSTFTITNTGAKTISGSATASACW